MIKAVIFDMGETIITYDKPLNWSSHYDAVLTSITQKCDYQLSSHKILTAKEILNNYNTRTHPRTYEVSSDTIFKKIINLWQTPLTDLEKVKDAFFSYFQRNALPFSDALKTLTILQDLNIMTGLLSDVPYGMDNHYIYDDIGTLRNYIDIIFTSNDIGYRKPCPNGLYTIAKQMNISTSEMLYIGDEEKDVLCANNAHAISVLINREGIAKAFGQQYEISSLTALLDIIQTVNNAR